MCFLFAAMSSYLKTDSSVLKDLPLLLSGLPILLNSLPILLSGFTYGMLNAFVHLKIFGKRAPIERIPVVALRMILWSLFLPVYVITPAVVDNLLFISLLIIVHQVADLCLVEVSLN